jgi:hypothetical protein
MNDDHTGLRSTEQRSGDAIPGLASQQLALAIEAPPAQVDLPVKVEHPMAERP